MAGFLDFDSQVAGGSGRCGDKACSEGPAEAAFGRGGRPWTRHRCPLASHPLAGSSLLEFGSTHFV